MSYLLIPYMLVVELLIDSIYVGCLSDSLLHALLTLSIEKQAYLKPMPRCINEKAVSPINYCHTLYLVSPVHRQY